MDESIAAVGQIQDRDFRVALHWWLRLKDEPTDGLTLSNFSIWLREPAHRKAFARAETLWQTVHSSLTHFDTSDSRSVDRSQSMEP